MSGTEKSWRTWLLHWDLTFVTIIIIIIISHFLVIATSYKMDLNTYVNSLRLLIWRQIYKMIDKIETKM